MGATGERVFVDGLAKFFGGVRREPIGIGDDAAVLRMGGTDVVLTCDPVVEGVHFDRRSASPRQVGRKAVLRNLSDLAAMGARATHLLVSVLLPRCGHARFRDALFVGLRDAAVEHGCQVVGGDIGSTPGPLTVTVTAVGVLRGAALRRDGARAGDRLVVSGPLGGAMERGRHLEPRPRLALGTELARRGVRAAIDLSDGLAIDLDRMLRCSRCAGAKLIRAALPLHRDAIVAANRTGRSAVEHALGDGEDYELLFAAPEGIPLPEGCVDIGRITAGDVREMPIIELIDDAGRVETQIAAVGYEHDV